MASALDDFNETNVDHYLTYPVPKFEQLRLEIQDTEDWVKSFSEIENCLSLRNFSPNPVEKVKNLPNCY